MKTNGLYALTAGDRREVSIHSQMLIVAAIIALIVAFLPAASVFAAPANDQGTTENPGLDKEWRDKLRNLRALGSYYDRIRLVPADFENQDDLALAQGYLDKYGFALKQANTVVFKHTGFDIKGNVINEIQAAQTVRDLAMYLHLMRGFRTKIEEI